MPSDFEDVCPLGRITGFRQEPGERSAYYGESVLVAGADGRLWALPRGTLTEHAEVDDIAVYSCGRLQPYIEMTTGQLPMEAVDSLIFDEVLGTDDAVLNINDGNPLGAKYLGQARQRRAELESAGVLEFAQGKWLLTEDSSLRYRALLEVDAPLASKQIVGRIHELGVFRDDQRGALLICREGASYFIPTLEKRLSYPADYTAVECMVAGDENDLDWFFDPQPAL